MMFCICNTAGDRVPYDGAWWDSLDAAVEAAKIHLENDPELGELTVWSVHPSGNLITHHKTVTFGPDIDWQTIIWVLDPGQHVTAPGPVPRRITEEDLEGYTLDDPKRAALEERLGEWY